MFGNPISPIDGSKVENEVDYASAESLLQVRRMYSSARGQWIWPDMGASATDGTQRTLHAPNPDAFGAPVLLTPSGYWPNGNPPREPRMRSFPLLAGVPGSAEKAVWITLPDGRRLKFVEGPTGTFTNASRERSTLTVTMPSPNMPQWTLRTDGDGYFMFDANGLLTQKKLPSGAAVTYARSASSVTATSNVSGRSLVYGLASPSRPASVTLPDNGQIVYTTDGGGRLTNVAYPGAASKTYWYDEPVHTGDPTAVRGLLTGVTDENGARTTTVKYEGVSAKSTERAGGTGKYSVQYLNFMSVVTLPNGTTTSNLSWEKGPDGERRLRSRSQAAGSGCDASITSMAYDAEGHRTSADNFNGKRTCFAYDATGRHLEIARVEGLAGGTACTVTAAGAALPVNTRKTSRQWHPDWRLETKVAEPGRITTYVYNGQPDPFNGNAVASCAPATALLPDGKRIAVLCKRVEQSTNDNSGAAGFSATLQTTVPNRVLSWTYNDVGQVLSEDGPRTDVADVTRYVYYTATTADYTKGDLQQVTNAVGKLTYFTKYNKHGQLLESRDANGVVSVSEYYPRQWLKSTAVGGQKTLYEYDLVGQLTKVTLPDGSFIGYEYDDAHRLKAVKDNLNNRTEYELDNAGNRIGENTKVGDNVKRHLTRSIDALGRVQQTTGRE